MNPRLTFFKQKVAKITKEFTTKYLRALCGLLFNEFVSPVNDSDQGGLP